MRYIPKLTKNQIEENHKYFIERVSIYKKRGIDFFATRRSILEKAYPLKGKILEIGPGNGHTTLALAKAGYKFISIDKDKGSLKKTALNLAYENVLSMVKLFVMDGNVLSFGEDSFENAIVVNLFHHLDKVNKMLLEIDRVLCAEGKVVLADFNEKGKNIVNAVHKKEGRIHEDFNNSENDIYLYLHGLGYEIRRYQEKYHWILIAEKKIQQ